MAKRDRPTDASSTSGSSTSDESTRKRKRSDKDKKKHSSKKQAAAAAPSDEKVNGTGHGEHDLAVVAANNSPFAARRNSVSKAARDPRDEPSFRRRATEGLSQRQLTPVIDTDGLSRACKFFCLYLCLPCSLHSFPN